MRFRIATLAVIAFITAAHSAAAQDEPPRELKEVFVRSVDGVEIRGQMFDLGPTTLSLFVQGSRQDIPLESIDRIQTRGGDSVLNGALIGASIAAGLWGWSVAQGGGEWAGLAIAGTIGYGLVGAGIDAMIPGRTTIYAKPRHAASQVTARRIGLAVKFGF